METLAETVALPPSPRIMRQQRIEGLTGVLLVVGVVRCSTVLVRRFFQMPGDIAKAWASHKAKRQAMLDAHAADVKMLRDQIEADGLDDADRAAIDEMKKEVTA